MSILAKCVVSVKNKISVPNVVLGGPNGTRQHNCCSVDRRWQLLKESVECRATPSGGINTQSHMELALNRRSEISFKCLGVKGGFIFTPVYLSDCGSDLQS